VRRCTSLAASTPRTTTSPAAASRAWLQALRSGARSQRSSRSGRVGLLLAARHCASPVAACHESIRVITAQSFDLTMAAAAQVESDVAEFQFRLSIKSAMDIKHLSLRFSADTDLYCHQFMPVEGLRNYVTFYLFCE